MSVTSLKSDNAASDVKPREPDATESISHADRVRAFQLYHQRLTDPALIGLIADADLFGRFNHDHA